ncbi:hypothetical protein [Dermatophilus congolensis]|uniref:Uncharacterized protein n=1 Tax=Dermatophilus congolensis TaxID=1863 RepID=A0A239VED4_9MICO|nr:hypothetical protein [Dermatophilus congolensis]MBO3128778.1 hypothetical protein [Dermatophilus congolensis]MBO3132586.1 hypothetical protein [Dermatophilus congolensis]MBO3133255.1 hypothetical protein [Dermatophilus congolensis]MBO3135489.1 hypothetical protein [Dermatophilus congolensis]MBO3137727.1 hypothetical protein [Dermatophilus congolensis]
MDEATGVKDAVRSESDYTKGRWKVAPQRASQLLAGTVAMTLVMFLLSESWLWFLAIPLLTWLMYGSGESTDAH